MIPKKLFLKINRHAKFQHIVISVSSGSLVLVHYRRILLTWMYVNSREISIPELSTDFSLTSLKIKEVLKEWELPDRTCVSWVLPSDIVGILNIEETGNIKNEVLSSIPFSYEDVQISENCHNINNNIRKNVLTVQWIHKDWIAEISKISDDNGLRCTELFSRAQLYQNLAEKDEKAVSSFIEGDNFGYFLHIISPRGEIIRSTKIESMSDEKFSRQMSKEYNSLNIDKKNSKLYSDKNFKLNDVEYRLVKLNDNLNKIKIISKLFLSRQEGIVLNGAHDGLLSSINLFNFSIGIIGSVFFGTMFWHDTYLVSEIENNRRQIRQNIPKYQMAQQIKNETIKMMDAVTIRKAYINYPSVFVPLSYFVNNISENVTLSFYSRSGSKLSIAGLQSEADMIRPILEKKPEVTMLTVAPLPDFLRNKKGTFSYEMVWTNETDSADASGPKGSK